MKKDELLKEVLALIDKYNITAYEIEKNTSLSAVGVQKIINGKSKRPLETTLETIISYITNEYEKKVISEGEMLIKKGQPSITTPTEEERKKEEVSSKIKIPYYDVDFAGGWSSEELFSNVMPLYHISAPEFERAEFACNLRGNSISKRIKSGSIVGLKEIKDWETYFPTNELYGVITKNDLRTIKIVKRSKEEGFLDLIPDALPEYNDPPYEAERVPINFIQKMFQVVAWGFYERLVM